MADLSSLLSSSFDTLLGSLKTSAKELADKVKVFSEDVAKDILSYHEKIVKTVEDKVNGVITASDADLSVKAWKTASKSAIKKLKTYTEWEAYEKFWNKVSTIFSIASALLGEISL